MNIKNMRLISNFRAGSKNIQVGLHHGDIVVTRGGSTLVMTPNEARMLSASTLAAADLQEKSSKG